MRPVGAVTPALFEREADLFDRLRESGFDGSEGTQSQRAGDQPEACELGGPSQLPAAIMRLGRARGAPAFAGWLGTGRRGGRGGLFPKQGPDENRVLGAESGAVTFRPGNAGHDHMAAAANLDIGAASGGLSRLDAEAMQRYVEDADVLPGSSDAHPCPDHDLLAILAWLQRQPTYDRAPLSDCGFTLKALIMELPPTIGLSTPPHRRRFDRIMKSLRPYSSASPGEGAFLAILSTCATWHSDREFEPA